MRDGIRKFVHTAAPARSGEGLGPTASLLRLSASPSGPSPEFRRHYDVEAPAIDARTFRPGWRRQTRLAALFAAGRISREAFVAATLWRGWVEAVGTLAVQRWTQRIGSAVLRDGATPAQITAAKALRDAGAALGEYRTRILFAHLIDDLSWREPQVAARPEDCAPPRCRQSRRPCLLARRRAAAACAGRALQKPARKLVMAGHPGRPRGSRGTVLCFDCGVDTVKTGQWCTLKNAIWAQAARSEPGAVLCLRCIARRLGRSLVAADFTAPPATLQRRGVLKTF
jgi:hypothetical protein